MSNPYIWNFSDLIFNCRLKLQRINWKIYKKYLRSKSHYRLPGYLMKLYSKQLLSKNNALNIGLPISQHCNIKPM